MSTENVGDVVSNSSDNIVGNEKVIQLQEQLNTPKFKYEQFKISKKSQKNK